MFKLAAIYVLAVFCVASTFSSNVQSIQSTCKLFRKAFNETGAELDGLALQPVDRQFYESLRNLISAEETETLRRVLFDLFADRNETIAEAVNRKKLIEQQLLVVSKLRNVNLEYPSDTRLYENSKLLHSILRETLEYFEKHPLNQINENDVIYKQNLHFYGSLRTLKLKLSQIGSQTNSALGQNFTRTFKVNGESKLFKIRNELVEIHRSKRDAKEVAKVLGFWACKLLEYISKVSNFEKHIAKFIYNRVPEEYQTEMLDTLLNKGIVAVTNLARMYCGLETKQFVNTLAMSVERGAIGQHKNSIFDIYNDVFPKGDVGFEFFTSFVYWYRISLHTAYDSLEQELNEVLSPVNKEILNVTKDLSYAGNEVLAVFDDDLRLEQSLKQSIKQQAQKLIALK